MKNFKKQIILYKNWIQKEMVILEVRFMWKIAQIIAKTKKKSKSIETILTLSILSSHRKSGEVLTSVKK